MIELPQIRKVDSEPWEIPLAKRLRMAASIRAEKRLAVLLYYKADTSTFRYRCYNVMQALEESEKWGAVYFFEEEYSVVAELLSQAHLMVMVRSKWDLRLEQLVRIARQKKVPLLFDVDDRVFDLDALQVLTNTLDVDLRSDYACDFWFAYVGRIQQAAALAQGFTTTNSFLGDELQKKFGKPYKIIQNTLNKEQLEISKNLRQEKARAIETPPFTIGYFSGTPSHKNDFLEIYKELLVFLQKYQNTQLRVVGFMEFPPEMQPMVQHGRVKFTPLVDFLELQRLVAQVDVNIVPLVENSFTNCKSELKFFEAAVVDTLTVATPTFTYKNCIKNGKNGFLCRPGRWFDTLEQIYLGRIDKKQICQKAREDALQRYCGQNFVADIEETYNFFAG